MSEKRMVSRSVAIAVVIICIALAIGLIGAVSFYTSQISSLNSKVNDLTDITNLDKTTLWVNSTVTQTANNYTSWFFSPSYNTYNSTYGSYAGFVVVLVLSSTSNTTYIRVSYSSGISYDNSVTVGTDGTVAFPVVFPIIRIASSDISGNPTLSATSFSPSPTIEIRVGNKDTVGNATETVEIFYNY